MAFTRRLLKRADKLRVHVPTSRVYEDGELVVTEYWSVGPFQWEEPYLNTKGIAEVRRAIREEEKWRMEKVRAWLPWVAALTGLIGALTGLVAVLG